MRLRRQTIVTALILTAILGAGMALRLYGLGERGFWLDESYSELRTRGTLHETVQGALACEGSPPLYLVLLHCWRRAAGTGEVGFRLLSALLDGFTILVVFALARQMLGRAASLTASGMYAFSSFAIFYAQEARQYALFALVAALSSYFFYRIAVSNKRREFYHYILYVLATAAALYSFPSALVVFSAQGLYVLIVVFRRFLAFLRGDREQVGSFRWGVPICLAISFIMFLPYIFRTAGRVLYLHAAQGAYSGGVSQAERTITALPGIARELVYGFNVPLVEAQPSAAFVPSSYEFSEPTPKLRRAKSTRPDKVGPSAAFVPSSCEFSEPTLKLRKTESKRPPARYGPVWEGGWADVLFSLLFIAAPVAFGILNLRGSKGTRAYFTCIFMVLPVWLILIPFRVHVIEAKHFIFLLPFVYIVMCVPFSRNTGKFAASPARTLLVEGLLVVAVFAGIQAYALADYYVRPVEKEHWRELTPILVEQLQPGDMIVFSPFQGMVPFEYYLPDNVERDTGLFATDGWRVSKEREGVIPFEILTSVKDWLNGPVYYTSEEWEKELGSRGIRRVWLVTNRSSVARETPRAEKALDEALRDGYSEVHPEGVNEEYTGSVGAVRIRLFKRKQVKSNI